MALADVTRLYAGVVALDYAAQVPYVLDLYGTQFSPRGAVLLGATLLWFLVGLGLFRPGAGRGRWVLIIYALVQFAFYFHGIVIMSAFGDGPLYQMSHARDPIVAAVFLVGYLTFIAAGLFLFVLLRGPGRTAPRGTA